MGAVEDAQRLASLRFLRTMGFFGNETRSDLDVARDFSRDGPLVEPRWLDEAYLAAEDADRGLLKDCECDPYPGNDAYVRWVEGLGRISRGHLRVLEVREKWLVPVERVDELERPVEIHVRLPERSLVLRPRQYGDYVTPMDLTKELDRLMPRGGPRFAHVVTGGQDALIFAFTKEERRRLERERGWRFHPEREERGPKASAGSRVGSLLRKAWEWYVAPFKM